MCGPHLYYETNSGKNKDEGKVSAPGLHWSTESLWQCNKEDIIQSFGKSWNSRIIDRCNKDSKSKVKTGNKLSGEFPTSNNLLQGCCMSPTLFKIYMDVVLKEWVTQCGKMGIKIGDKHLSHLFFADDQVNITQNKEVLKLVTEEAFKSI